MAWENITPEVKAKIVEYVNECESQMYGSESKDHIKEWGTYEVYAARKWAFVHGLCVAGLFKHPTEFIQWLVETVI